MKKILIIGLGLIGASYAKGLTKKGYEVYGCDLSDETNEFAVSSGFVCAASKDPTDYIKLVRNKLAMLKEEIKYKQMMRIRTVNYENEKGRSL